jgi:5-carboxymethyl-2-hydroxymuconate isomerase
MPHFVLEYSDNIDRAVLALPALFEKLHASAMDTGLFPLKGLRCRAYPCADFRMADGNPEHSFVHLSVLLGTGRSMPEKEAAAKQFFAVLEQPAAASPCLLK